jgi:hypothetical protein
MPLMNNLSLFLTAISHQDWNMKMLRGLAINFAHFAQALPEAPKIRFEKSLGIFTI